MIDKALVKRVLAVRSVRPAIIFVTGAASIVGLLSALIQGWPLWGIALAAILPWIPLLTSEIVWTYRHYHWLALFYVLVITQGGHVVEHVAQMIQIHLLRVPGPHAHGIFGALDIEWVHFIWNSWILVAVVALVIHFPRNPWLWATLILAGWHEAEHMYIIGVYLATGQPGTPGLLARGGLINGGLSLRRPDLHFLYNLVETAPLVAAFIYQLRRTFDAWLKRAFPHVTLEMLAETTCRLQPLRFAPGTTIMRRGDAAERLYILSKGEVIVTAPDGTGGEAVLDVLQPGQYFGEIGLLSLRPRTATVTAKTPVEVLVLDPESFHTLVGSSRATAEEITALIRHRLLRSDGNVGTG